MIRLILHVLAAVGVLYAGLCVVLFCFQRSLIYFPQQRNFASGESTTTLQVPGAELRLAVRPLRGTRAVLYFGGNAEDVSASLPDLSRAFPHHAIYLLHYRGYGGSSGKPSEHALHSDALALFDKVHREHSEIVVVGRSLGSGVAVRLASVRPVSRLVLVTPFDSLQGLAVQQFPFFPVRWLLLDTFESSRFATKVRAPTTILVAEHDEVISRWSSELLYSRFEKGIAAYQVIPGVGHNSISASPAYLQAVSALP